jgi:hypothetical protein
MFNDKQAIEDGPVYPMCSCHLNDPAMCLELPNIMCLDTNKINKAWPSEEIWSSNGIVHIMQQKALDNLVNDP